MIILNILTSLMIPLFAGYVVIHILFKNRQLPVLPKLTISYGLGFGILTQWMLLLCILKIPLGLISIGLPLLIAALFFFIFHLDKTKQCVANFENKNINRKISLFRLSFLAFIFLNVYIIFWEGLVLPVSGWDDIATHAFQGKIIYYDRSLENQIGFPHNSYPFQIPFMLSWIAFNLGAWHDQLIKIVFPVFCVSFLYGQYYFLRKFTNSIWALGGVVLLVSSSYFTYHAALAYRDFTLMYYNCFAIIFLILWSIDAYDSWIYLASFFSGICSFTKSEGVGYIFIHFILLLFLMRGAYDLSIKEKLKKMFKFIIPGLSIFFTYYLFKFASISYISIEGRKQSGFNISSLAIAGTKEHFSRIPEVLKLFEENLFLSANWNIIWGILLISLIINHKRIFKVEIMPLLLSLALYFGVYIIGYSFTQHFVWISESDSVLSRCILQFFPISTMLIILLNCPSKEETN